MAKENRTANFKRSLQRGDLNLQDCGESRRGKIFSMFLETSELLTIFENKIVSLFSHLLHDE